MLAPMQPFDARFELTRQDALEALGRIRRVMRRAVWILGAGVAALGFWLLGRGASLGMAAAMWAEALVLLALPPLIWRWFIWRQRRLFLGDWTLSAEPDALRIQSPISETKLPKTSIQRVLETPNLLLLMIGPYQGVYVPKRALTPAQIDCLRSYRA